MFANALQSTDLVKSPGPPSSRSKEQGRSTGRTAGTPTGNPDFPSVRAGNYIACRTLVLVWIAAALQAWWILEQPKNSLMQDLPAFKALMRNVRTFRHHILMKHYGGPTDKPTWLYSGSSKVICKFSLWFPVMPTRNKVQVSLRPP